MEPKVVMSIERLKILCNICPEYTFSCKEWDAIYSAHEVKFPLCLVMLMRMLRSGKIKRMKKKLL